MALARVMDKPEDYERLGVNPSKVEAWEDGLRDTAGPMHGEIWYMDCSFDDGSTLVVGFRPKSTDWLPQPTYNPNVAINYNEAGSEIPFCDYRLYEMDQVSMSKESCEVRFGPNAFVGDDWKSYDIHIEPEADRELVFEGKRSVEHKSCIDLHFEALTEPFRPGTGYVSFGENDELYYNFICVTRLSVTGTVELDGKRKDVAGSAYYNHQWFNTSPMGAFHHWVWGRQNVGNYGVMIYYMVANARFGFAPIPLFTIDDAQGNRVFENVDAEGMTSEILGTYHQDETDKDYPDGIRYTFDKNGMHIVFEITEPKEINVLNLYGNAPEAQRAQFDALGLKPTYARYNATTRLTIERDGTAEVVDGSMLYEFAYMAATLDTVVPSM